MPGFGKRRRVLIAFAAVMTAVLLPAFVLFAQNAGEDTTPREPVFKVGMRRSDLRIVEKFAKIVETSARITRVDGFDPEVVAVTAISASQLRVQAVKSGVTTIVLTDENNETWQIDVLVIGDVRHLQAYIDKLFPHASVNAVELKGAVVLKGWVTEPSHINEIIDIADQFYPDVLNHMKVGGTQQVLLRCKILEVQRSKIRSLGMNFISQTGNGYLASTPGPITPIENLQVNNAGSNFSLQGFADSTFTFGLINSSRIFQGFIQALKEEGLLKIKAEPVLVTTNGRPATLLQGGEFPIVVPAGLGTVAIEWREFGVRMEAVPIMLGGGRLRLDIQPEVSERDFASQVTVNGVAVPGLTVRRANTRVEMNFGETLIIAGLISNRRTASTQKVPVLGDIPYLGAAFSRKRYEESETELIVVVTPEYVSPLSPSQAPKRGPGEQTTIPTSRELLFQNLIEIPKYGNECAVPSGIHTTGGCSSCGTTGCAGGCADGGIPSSQFSNGSAMPNQSAYPDPVSGSGGMVTPSNSQHYDPGPSSFPSYGSGTR